MVGHAAGGSGRAGIVKVAGIDTLLAHAGLVSWAVIVDLAFGALAVLEGVAICAGRTDAGGGVGAGLAPGVGGARVVDQAGVDALVLVADLVVAALAVPGTFNCKKVSTHLIDVFDFSKIFTYVGNIRYWGLRKSRRDSSTLVCG